MLLLTGNTALAEALSQRPDGLPGLILLLAIAYSFPSMVEKFIGRPLTDENKKTQKKICYPIIGICLIWILIVDVLK